MNIWECLHVYNKHEIKMNTQLLRSATKHKTLKLRNKHKWMYKVFQIIEVLKKYLLVTYLDLNKSMSPH